MQIKLEIETNCLILITARPIKEINENCTSFAPVNLDALSFSVSNIISFIDKRRPNNSTLPVLIRNYFSVTYLPEGYIFALFNPRAILKIPFAYFFRIDYSEL